jgi:hypothetical protein
MVKQKHKPQRTCVACRETKDKQELIRVVRTPDQEIVIDPTGKANGRGAYLCKNIECLEKGLNKGFLSRALKTAISPEERLKLLAHLLPTQVTKEDGR